MCQLAHCTRQDDRKFGRHSLTSLVEVAIVRQLAQGFEPSRWQWPRERAYGCRHIGHLLGSCTCRNQAAEPRPGPLRRPLEICLRRGDACKSDPRSFGHNSSLPRSHPRPLRVEGSHSFCGRGAADPPGAAARWSRRLHPPWRN